MKRRLACLLVACLALSGCGLVGASLTVCDDGLDGQSVARRWNEQLLDAIRRDTPAPTVHARNLFHTSAAMWDAWAAYDDSSTALFVDASKPLNADERSVSVSYAAYTVLTNRYRNAVGGSESLVSFDQELTLQCLNVPSIDNEDLSDAALLGVEIAETILEETIDDGSFELDGYLDLSYMGANPPLVVDDPGVGDAAEPDRWQPLQLAEAITQNEQVQVQPLQFFIGPHWGSVTPFALDPSPDGLPIDPGTPPLFSEDPDAFIAAAVEVLEYQRSLDVSVNERRDYGPASIGNNSLGSNDGSGHATNPVTGQPYAPNELAVADFGRVVAEFWADGPSSETPPGHWNTVANFVSDDPQLERRINGSGDVVDRLEWDVKMYLALNGGMHDAAIAAWGAKRVFDSSRPITAIRYLAELGQSTDQTRDNYHPNGLPLIDGLIEIVTEETSADRHAGLLPGMLTVRAWAGHKYLHNNYDEIAWIDATTWVPYQLDTFVTPSFPGYVSGHSAFSRAGAEVLTQFTGSEFFPGGLGEWTAPAGWLRFDDGPDEPVTLQWATYQDAADQAGESRLYGGIHIGADDVDGRILGATCGRGAVAKAFELFG